MKKQIALIITLFLVTFAWVSITLWYLWTHKYYIEMLSNSTNLWVVIFWLVCALIPSYFLFFTNKPSLRKSILWVVWGLYVFLLWYLVQFWSSALSGIGSIKLLINCTIMLSLLAWFVSIVTVLWWIINKKLLKIGTESLRDLVLNFWMWLVSFLLIIYFLALLNLLFPLVSRLLVMAWALLIIRNKNDIHDYALLAKKSATTINNKIRSFWSADFFEKLGIVLICTVIVIWFWYLFNWYLLSYMPYSTAWDANHAYMFYPKMRALHNGVYRSEVQMAVTPHLWDMFITFWFSLFQWSWWILYIAPDTIALVMNFFSWVFVFLLWIVVVKEIISYVKEFSKDSNTNTDILLWFWWLLLLAWLTSWMWAFLVFIDNKTDLWVLTILLLALFAGLVFLRKVLQNDKDYTNRFAVLSWFFFAVAALCKSTAMFDVLSFWVFTWWVWFGVLWVVWIVLSVIWLFATLQFRSMKDYIGWSVWNVLLWSWLIVWLFELIKTLYDKNKYHIKLLAIWIWTFLLTVCIVKIPFIVGYNIIYDESNTPTRFIERVLFSQNWSTKLSWSICTLQSQWLVNEEQLYDWMPESSSWNSYDEDVGRYIWYWWKWWVLDAKKSNQPYKNLLVTKLLDDWCIGRWEWKILCENKESLDNLSVIKLEKIRNLLSSDSEAYSMISSIINQLPSQSSLDQEQKNKYFAQEIRNLRSIMESNSILIETIDNDQYVYIPNKYLNFLNVTYNRSLQNYSSYYTDIGMVWLLLLIFNFVGFIYWIWTRERILVAATWTTLFSWVVWHLIAWWIVWYNLWMIVRSILSFVIFLYYLQKTEGREIIEFYKGTLLVVLMLFILFQIILNLFRITSHWIRVWWSFLFYKTNQWVSMEIDSRMQRVYRNRWLYWQEEVFDEQFRHYKALIDWANNRWEDQWVWIAWTYARYFIENQNNIKYDQFLNWLQPMFFDWNACRSYLRLKDNNISYLAIDPNIWTVVQWDWNRSLYDRFFGEVNEVNWEIKSYWAITMFTQFLWKWLARLVKTNNLGAKYAWVIPDSAYASVPEESRELFKSRMSVSRFTARNPKDNNFIPIILDIATQRLENGLLIEDLADIFGYTIDTNKLLNIIKSWTLDWTSIQGMSQDERKAMEQFIHFRTLYETNKEEYQSSLQDLIANSIYSPNQIIVIQLVE